MHLACTNDPVNGLCDKAKEALNKYLCTREIEQAALGMVRHYKRKRQKDFHDYLRQYMELTKHPDFDDSHKAMLQECHRDSHTLF